MEDPFGEETDLREEIVPKKENKLKKLWPYIIIILALVIAGVVLLIIFLTKSNDKNKEKEKIFSQMICKYRVDDCSKSVILFGEDFQNNNDTIINLVINGTKIV